MTDNKETLVSVGNDFMDGEQREALRQHNKEQEAAAQLPSGSDKELDELHDELHKMIQCSLFGWPEGENSKAHQLLYKIRRVTQIPERTEEVARRAVGQWCLHSRNWTGYDMPEQQQERLKEIILSALHYARDAGNT